MWITWWLSAFVGLNCGKWTIMHVINNTIKWDSAGTCFGEADFAGQKFKYPGENSVKDITVN